MIKNSRKVITFVIASLLTLFIAVAVPRLLNRSGATVANAQEVQTAAAADETPTDPAAQPQRVPVINEDTIPYSGTAYKLNAEYYVMTRIVNADGQEVSEAKDAGKYTVYYTPAENFVWAGVGGTFEKELKLTVEKATLKWFFPKEVAMTEPKAEIVYSEQRKDQVEHVRAYGVLNNYNYQKIPFNILKNGESISKKVIDAGVYTFTVPDDYNYENPTFTLTIKPKEVDISQYVNLQWIKEFDNKSLNAGEIYSYTYNIHGSTEKEEAYTAIKLDKAPFANWDNWQPNGTEPIRVAHGAVAYREGDRVEIKLRSDTGTMAYYNAVYSGVTAAEKSGKYIAEAVISPVPNYTMKYEPNPAQDMEITPNGDGTFSIKKTWYIVHFVNEFLSETSRQSTRMVPYEFPTGWTYGTMPQDGIPVPCLAHGDEIRMMNLLPDAVHQPNGYTLFADGAGVLELNANEPEPFYYDGMEGWKTGDNDLVTFTIVRRDAKGEETICTGEPRKRFSYYINDYTPVGSYTITFRAKRVGLGGEHDEWWNGVPGKNCGSEYLGITQSFDFEVTPRTLDYDDGDLSYNGLDALPPVEVNDADLVTSYEPFFNISQGKLKYNNLITKETAAASNTYWATVADHYYGDPRLKFKLSGDTYYYKTDDIWSELITGAGSYRVYYTVGALNYAEITDEERLNTQYFLVNVFEVIEQPVLIQSILNYTGEPRKVRPAVADSRFTVTGDTQTEIGEYKAVFTITDPVKYRWQGLEGAVCEVPWSIVQKKVNSWTNGGTPQIIGWKWNGYDRTVNLVKAEPLDGIPVFCVTEDEAGTIVAEGLESFRSDANGVVTADIGDMLDALSVGTHYLWCRVEETLEYSAIASTPFKFTVELADNAWVTQPEISKWTVGEEHKLPTAEAEYGTVQFKIVAEADASKVYYDSVNSINKLSEIPAGRYLLTAFVLENDKAYKSLTIEKPLPVYAEGADGDWIILPTITGWSVDGTPNEPQGTPSAFGATVAYKYFTKDGAPLGGRPNKAGEYVMEATAYAKDGTQIAVKRVDFTLTGGNGGDGNLLIIILCCVFGVLLIVCAVLIAVFLVRRRRNRDQEEQTEEPEAQPEPQPEEEREHSDELEIAGSEEADQEAQSVIGAQAVLSQEAEIDEDLGQAEEPEVVEPVVEATPVEEQQPAAEEQPVVEEEPAVEETPVEDEDNDGFDDPYEPTEAETPVEEEAVEEQPAIEEPVEEQPVEEQEPAQEEQPEEGAQQPVQEAEEPTEEEGEDGSDDPKNGGDGLE